ncbi:MAG: hypothetical protein FJY73_12260 [Candidatus Eisenbacteria bacterium]|nr:hypothetical protein [Candidatus Eisenbacteria bacterium]
MHGIHASQSLYLRGRGEPKPHLWFILTNPEGDPPQVVAVMLQTATRFTDETVVLQPGEHSFVRHASSVHYSTAKYFSVPAISRALRTGECHLREDVSESLLEKLRAGLLDSPFTVNAIKEYCRGRF